MNRTELSEATTATSAVLITLLRVLNSSVGMTGATLRYRCGALATNGAALLDAGGNAFWIALAACFEAAPSAGATFDTMDAVRSTAEALTPQAPAAVAVKNFCVRMALAEQARILAATVFVSRQDIDVYFDRINASFDLAETVAADNMDNVAYKALISIHASVSNDLANRSRPLPRMMKYLFPQRMPSLWLAQRIFCDPARNDELIAENKPIHPLFMPSSGNVLSA